ncbi:hypothetical protein QUB63_15980 [Microcoleus sp. ARI1-B5]|uniref:hypothetical protein n=1 Tax=unclassified Microcoleus TaxID=2642155 RepID=UPI002FD508D0
MQYNHFLDKPATVLRNVCDRPRHHPNQLSGGGGLQQYSAVRCSTPLSKSVAGCWDSPCAVKFTPTIAAQSIAKD